jgi:hypothetical protein
MVVEERENECSGWEEVRQRGGQSEGEEEGEVYRGLLGQVSSRLYKPHFC